MSALYVCDALEGKSAGDCVALESTEVKHLSAVLRKSPGAKIVVSDGKGYYAHAVLVQDSGGGLHIRLEQVHWTHAQKPALILVQALAKGGRDELSIQLATELGISAIVPWSAARSIVRWEGQKQLKGQLRWQAIVQQACKQSFQSYFPTVHPLSSTFGLCKLAAQKTLVVLDPRSQNALSEFEPDATSSEIFIVIGPEGGITPEEERAFDAAGAQRYRLGSSILRTSTAAAAALTLLNFRTQRW